MTTDDFTLILSSPTELTEQFADDLYAAGCDDSTPSSTDGLLSIDFAREASDLESAIRSAVSDVATTGDVVIASRSTRMPPFSSDNLEASHSISGRNPFRQLLVVSPAIINSPSPR
jgi:hypothetical protein